MTHPTFITSTQPRLLIATRLPESPIRWSSIIELDKWGSATIGYYGGWAVQINAMIFNDRLVLAEPGIYGSPCYGWCYPKGGAAHLAALAWDPETDGEPAGYKKAAIGGRQPGERAPWWIPVMA